jgi:endonuclease/exonuclease/phosphatase family metal-dependent hydrolase
MSLLRFLCMNIHGGRSLDGRRDLGRVHALMESLDVHIGVFQEMETRKSRGGSAKDIDFLAGPSRPYRFEGPSFDADDGWYGNLIVSRYEILRGIVHNLDTPPHLEPRNAVDALIRTPYGTIRVIGTHLSLALKERRAEAMNLLRLAEAVEHDRTHPVFLMGDINEWQWPSKLIWHLDNVMTPIPAGRTFPSLFPLFRLDRAWHDAPRLQARATVLKDPKIRVLSDHLPVLVEVLSFGEAGTIFPAPALAPETRQGRYHDRQGKTRLHAGGSPRHGKKDDRSHRGPGRPHP